jgi:hypothetical protein
MVDYRGSAAFLVPSGNIELLGLRFNGLRSLHFDGTTMMRGRRYVPAVVAAF